jgi:hypothetical protein
MNPWLTSENAVKAKFAEHGFTPVLYQGWSGDHVRRRVLWNHEQPRDITW